MKLDVMSDLHLDILPWHLVQDFFAKYQRHIDTKGYPDLLLVAGDIASYKDVQQRTDFLKQLYGVARQSNILTIPGNHDFWHAKVKPDTNAVDKKTVKCQGVEYEVLMGTGWFETDPVPNWLTKYWPDYRYIDGAKWSIGTAHVKFLNELKVSTADIVMTHHFPEESTMPRWKGSETNCFFSSPNFTKALASAPKMPKLLVHGHTHDFVDYIHPQGYRVYCNPLGYNSEGVNKGFWGQIRIEL